MPNDGKMRGRLDPDIAILLERGRSQPPFHALGLRAARDKMRKDSALLPKPECAVKDVSIANKTHRIPLRVYKPFYKDKLPVLVWLHGGGFVLGDLETHDALCRELANEAKCLVVSVGYRLAPEFPFPAAVEDAIAAVNWVLEGVEPFGGDPYRIIIGGDSAGGTLAVSSALYFASVNYPRLSGLVLVYPTVDTYNSKRTSYKDFGSGFGLATEDMIWFWELYLKGDKHVQTYVARPILSEDLWRLPPTLVVVAECDVLRDEGVEFYLRLKQENVRCTLVKGLGMVHGFFRWRRFSARADELFCRTCRWIVESFEASENNLN